MLRLIRPDGPNPVVQLVLEKEDELLYRSAAFNAREELRWCTRMRQLLVAVKALYPRHRKVHVFMMHSGTQPCELFQPETHAHLIEVDQVDMLGVL